MARLRVRGIAAAADGDTSDVIAGGEEEEPKPRALRRPAAEHANASAHLLPVEEATGATALGRSEREEAPRLEAREEDDAEIGRGIVFKKKCELAKTRTQTQTFSVLFELRASAGSKSLSRLFFSSMAFGGGFGSKQVNLPTASWRGRQIDRRGRDTERRAKGNAFTIVVAHLDVALNNLDLFPKTNKQPAWGSGYRPQPQQQQQPAFGGGGFGGAGGSGGFGGGFGGGTANNTSGSRFAPLAGGGGGNAAGAPSSSSSSSAPASDWRSVVRHDSSTERPRWPLSCYAHERNRACDFEGDVSFEEARWLRLSDDEVFGQGARAQSSAFSALGRRDLPPSYGGAALRPVVPQPPDYSRALGGGGMGAGGGGMGAGGGGMGAAGGGAGFGAFGAAAAAPLFQQQQTLPFGAAAAAAPPATPGAPPATPFGQTVAAFGAFGPPAGGIGSSSSSTATAAGFGSGIQLGAKPAAAIAFGGGGGAAGAAPPFGAPAAAPAAPFGSPAAPAFGGGGFGVPAVAGAPAVPAPFGGAAAAGGFGGGFGGGGGARVAFGGGAGRQQQQQHAGPFGGGGAFGGGGGGAFGGGGFGGGGGKVAAPIPDATTSFAAKAGLLEAGSSGAAPAQAVAGASDPAAAAALGQPGGDPAAAAWAAAAFEKGKIPEEAPPEVFCR